MPRRCAIRTCPNSKGVPTTSVHVLPKSDHTRRTTWIQLINEYNNSKGKKIKGNIENYGVCSDHFPESEFQVENGNKGKRKVTDTSFPSKLKLPRTNPHSQLQRTRPVEPRPIIQDSIQENINTSTVDHLKKEIKKRDKIIEEKDIQIKSYKAKIRRFESKPKPPTNLEIMKKICSHVFTLCQIQFLMRESRTFCHWDSETLSKKQDFWYNKNRKGDNLEENQELHLNMDQSEERDILENYEYDQNNSEALEDYEEPEECVEEDQDYEEYIEENEEQLLDTDFVQENQEFHLNMEDQPEERDILVDYYDYAENDCITFHEDLE